jgi:dipeptidase E
MFIGGGNTFRLLDTLYVEGLIEPIRRRVAGGMPYMGTSAGSNVAGATIRTTNDMPIVQPPTFEALGLVDFQINPHFVDADPDSTHKGETREQRLAEFHEENETPVVAIREGTALVVEDDRVTLVGERGGRLFLRGRPTEDCPDGTRIDGLIGGG